MPWHRLAIAAHLASRSEQNFRMDGPDFNAQQRQKEQKVLRSFLRWSLLGSVTFHAGLLVLLPTKLWQTEPELDDDAIEIVMIDPAEDQPTSSLNASEETGAIANPSANADAANEEISMASSPSQTATEKASTTSSAPAKSKSSATTVQSSRSSLPKNVPASKPTAVTPLASTGSQPTESSTQQVAQPPEPSLSPLEPPQNKAPISTSPLSTPEAVSIPVNPQPVGPSPSLVESPKPEPFPVKPAVQQLIPSLSPSPTSSEPVKPLPQSSEPSRPIRPNPSPIPTLVTTVPSQPATPIPRSTPSLVRPSIGPVDAQTRAAASSPSTFKPSSNHGNTSSNNASTSDSSGQSSLGIGSSAGHRTSLGSSVGRQTSSNSQPSLAGNGSTPREQGPTTGQSGRTPGQAAQPTPTPTPSPVAIRTAPSPSPSVAPTAKPAGVNKPVRISCPKTTDLGQEGIVRIVIDVNSKGRVENVRLRESSGDLTLDDAALDIARRCKYQASTTGYRDVKLLLTFETKDSEFQRQNEQRRQLAKQRKQEEEQRRLAEQQKQEQEKQRQLAEQQRQPEATQPDRPLPSPMPTAGNSQNFPVAPTPDPLRTTAPEGGIPPSNPPESTAPIPGITP
jgi:TonB family protein